MKKHLVSLAALALAASNSVAAAPRQRPSMTPAPKSAAMLPAPPPPAPLPVFEFMGQTTDTNRTMSELQGERCKTDGAKATCANYGYPTIAGRPMQFIVMEFLDDRLYMVLATFGELAYQPVADAFIAKYGQPTQTEVRKWQSKVGATFDNKVLIWKFTSGGTFEVESMGSKVDEGRFMFMSSANAPPTAAPKVDF